MQLTLQRLISSGDSFAEVQRTARTWLTQKMPVLSEYKMTRRVNELSRYLRSLWIQTRGLPHRADTVELLAAQLSTCMDVDVGRCGLVYVMAFPDSKVFKLGFSSWSNLSKRLQIAEAIVQTEGRLQALLTVERSAWLIEQICHGFLHDQHSIQYFCWSDVKQQAKMYSEWYDLAICDTLFPFMESLIGMSSEQLVKLQKRYWANWMAKVENLSPNACKTITALLADKDARAHDGASLARRKEDIPAHALHTFSSLEEFQAAEADMQALIGQQVLI